MIIDCVSDLHGSYPSLPGGDLLIIAGDLTARDEGHQYFEFFEWLIMDTEYRKKIVIGGNHDGMLQNHGFNIPKGFDSHEQTEYLCDSGTEFEGLKIWGSPWTPPFLNWHFMLKPEEIKKKWDLIPEDTDILITHGPSLGILDNVYRIPSNKRDRCGCPNLRDAVERVKPLLHVFGHIHASYGQTVLKHHDSHKPDTICVNAAHMDEDYRPVNKPIRIEL